MLHDTAQIMSADFPEIVVTVKRPGSKDWIDCYQELGRGNSEEAYLNLLISVGSVATTDGSKAPLLGALADEWSNLSEVAFSQAALMAGSWGAGVPNTHRLDLAAILAAAERVATTQAEVTRWTALREDRGTAPAPSSAEDLALATLAEKCATFGFNADLMRTTLACHPRRGAFRAYLVDDIGCFVFTRPGTSARSAWDRRTQDTQGEACSRFVTTCCAFPPAGELLAIGSRLPAFMTHGAAEIVDMRGDVAVEVKKGSTASKPPPETPSPLPPA